MRRARFVPSVAALLLWGLCTSVSAAPSVRLQDLANRPIDPFAAGRDSRAIVFLFTSIDCPISNRYAPVVKQLIETFARQNIAFWLVYPNPVESSAAIRAHLSAYDYPVHALRDPKHELVKLTKAVVTPEAAVFDRTGALAYRGRLDDRYVSLGVERPMATRQDLAEALTSVLASRQVAQPVTQAVGCYIADFMP